MIFFIKFKFSNGHISFCNKEPVIIHAEGHWVSTSKLKIVNTIATINVTTIAPTRIHNKILFIFLLFKCLISESIIITNVN